MMRPATRAELGAAVVLVLALLAWSQLAARNECRRADARQLAVIETVLRGEDRLADAVLALFDGLGLTRESGIDEPADGGGMREPEAPREGGHGGGSRGP